MKNNYLITQPTLLRSVLLAIFAMAGVSMSYAQIIVRDTFLANGSYTVPSGVTTITVQAWGGGGGGGRGFSRSNSAAGGGGGAFSQSALSVTPGDVFSVTVGTGGTGGTQDVAGTNGTATNFGGLVIAPGGFAPVDVIAGQFGSNPGLGGPAGTGDITRTGGNGAAKPTNFVGGGGGSSGGTTGNGNNATGQTGGVAPGFGGNGGDGGSNLAPGLPGFVPGGGGGGKGGGQNVASGNGASGMVIVTYEIPEVELDCPDDVTLSACSSQSAVNAAFNSWISSFTFTGGCGTPEASFDDEYTAPSACGGSVTVTYRVASDCEPDKTCERTFAVTAAPTLSVSCPSTVTIPACSTQATVDAAFATWIAGFTTSGGCGTVSTDLSGFEAPSFCGGVVNITFTANDDCGQSETCTSIFTVTAAPTLSVSCPSAVTIPACSTQDDVDAAFADWIAGFTTSGGCSTVSTDLSGFEAPSFCGGVVNITFTANDDCGQSETCTSTFTVTAAPTLSVTCPAAVTIPACSTQATVDAAFATWIAGFTTTGGCGTVSTDLSGFEAPSFCGGTVSITYTASDNCGQSQTCTSTFIVTAAPTLSVTCPAAVTIPACSTQATVDAAFATWIAGFTTTGGCGTVSTDLSGFSAPSFCGGSVSITYTASDNCGQAQSCTSTFIVTAAPTLSVTCPAAVTIPACSTQATVDAAFATWIAGFTTTGGCGTVSTDLSGFSAPSFCGGSVSITYTASDNCGQAQSCTSTFTVTAAPTLSVTCPSAVTIPACSTQAAVDAAFATWIAGFTTTGGCGTVSTDLSGFSAPSFCGGSVSITYTASDNCGQSQTCTSTFTVTAAPTLSVSCPSAVTIPSCSSQSAVNAAFAGWIAGFTTTGGCGTVSTDLSGFSAPSFCGGSVSITFTASDNCGQAQSCTSTFTVTAAPTLSVTCPSPVTIPACSTQAAVDAAFATWIAGFSAAGGCGTETTDLSGFEAPSFCGGVVNITFTANDDCGQSETCTSTFTVTAAPTLSVTCPANVTMPACSTQEDVDMAFEVWLSGFSTSGGCNPVTTGLSGFIGGNPSVISLCGGSVTIVYAATDDCGQAVSCSSTFAVEIRPALTVSCPGNETVAACSSQEDVDSAFAAWLEGFGYTGGCFTTATNLENFEAPSFCGGSVTIVYTAEDACDQTASCSATFTVTAAPVLTVSCPGNQTIAACTDPEAVEEAFETWIAGFDFDGGCNATGSDLSGFSAPSFCGGSVTVVYSATDDCDQTSSCVAVFTVTSAPVLTVTCPSNETISSCTDQEDVDAAFEEWLESFGFDGGCNAVATDLSDLTAPSFCGGVVTVVYTASDDCNQTSSCVAVFTVESAPVLTVTCPSNETISSCTDQEDVDAAFEEWLESFGFDGGCNTVASDLSGFTAPSFCGGVVTVVYTASDDCNQTSSCVAVFTVESAPILAVTCPENAEIPACATQEAVDAAFADWIEGFSVTGGCNPTTSGLEEIAAPDACGGSVTVVFTATDDCDQTSSCAAVFTVLPVTGLAFDSELPASETVECDNVPEPIQVSASNNCGNVEVSYEEETESGDCAGDYVITRTWTATDCTGSITHIQIVTVQDTQAPELQEDLPGGILENVLKSDAPSAPAESEIAGLYSDNCTGVNAELIDSAIEGTECEWTAIYTYRITDDCGNEADEAVVVYQGIDTQAPVIESCADISVFAEVGECDAVVEIVTPEYSDNCEVTIEGVRNDQLELDDLYPVGTTTITWTAIDEGGNTAVCVQTITVIEAQRIAVFGQGIEIENGSVTPIPLDGTKFGSVSLGGMITKTFTITNIGCINLDLTGSPAVVLTGPGASFFSVVTQPAVTSLAPGSSTTFQVRYTGSAYGVHEATVIIANNDPMNDPFTFAISAATSRAIMRVTGNNITIPNGDVTPQMPDFTDFGVITFNGTRTRTFRVHNDGIANLLLTGNPRVQLFGAGAAKFVVTTQPQATITPGANRLFQITFTGNEVGVFVATVSIENTDLGASPYTFDIVATVLPSSMQVRGNNIIIANGDDTPQTADNTDFGFWAVGTTHNRTFTVNNVGAGHLFLSGSPRVQLSGPNADQFFVSSQPVALIAPASSSIFRITYAPTDAGTHTALVTISNNDASNNPYVFTITGAAAIPLKQGGIFEAPYVADKKEVGDMRLYPNPAFDQVFVELPVSDQSYRVEFISIDGRVIHSLQTQGGRLEVNVTAWKPGMYMMRATGIDVAPVRFIRAE